MMAWSAENETTNFFGWGDVEAVGGGWKTPHSGSQSLVLKNWLGGGDGVEQKPGVLGNTSYDLSFWTLWDSGYDGTLDVQVRWINVGGSQIGSNTMSFSLGAFDTWAQSSYTVVSMADSARAEINFQNSGGTAGALYLDDVYFNATAIPEPATISLLSLSLLVLAGLRTRRSAPHFFFSTSRSGDGRSGSSG